MNLTNCQNCGAPVDLTADKCPYCDTPYPRPRKTKTAQAEAVHIEIDGRALAKCVKDGIFSQNEARRLMGLPQI
jgi:hypothetical protein